MNCQNCGKEILDALRVTKRFCSDKCRITHHYSKDKIGLNPDYSQLNTENKITVNDKDSVKREDTKRLHENCSNEQTMLEALNDFWMDKEDRKILSTAEGCLNIFVMRYGKQFVFDAQNDQFVLEDMK